MLTIKLFNRVISKKDGKMYCSQPADYNLGDSLLKSSEEYSPGQKSKYSHIPF